MTYAWAAQVAKGISISFASGFLAKITKVSVGGIEVEDVDITHMATAGAKEFLPGEFPDNGEIEVDLQWKTDTLPPVGNQPEATVITWPVPHSGTTGATWAFDSYLKSFSGEAQIGELMTASATLKVSGDITVTAAS
jgi:hypothetical protein